MAEKRVEVKVYQVTYTCDECDEGEMLAVGFALMSSPPQYPHTCNNCGFTKNFRGIKYPKTVYEQN